ncbi:Inosine-uridine preferring nucleoside hydrolase [Bacillus altitudinis]|nr:Inosine-uridine preferring nucleoside hydrolase [Bacillus altitudinis]
MANKKKLILDVDTGIDDAIGILLAVKSKRFDMLGSQRCAEMCLLKRRR